MTSYVKAISKRNEGDDKEKTLPIAHLGSSMVTHGEDFDVNSEYGQCLISGFLLYHTSTFNTTNTLFSVWAHGRAHRAHPRELHHTGDFELARIPGAISHPNERLPGTRLSKHQMKPI